jgi:hypothetical protein
MLDRAKDHGFAYPAINVASSQMLNAAIKGFADARSDGIVQISTGGAQYLSGVGVRNMATGALALAAFAHEVARRYDLHIALHTDHCPIDKLDGFVRPLLAVHRAGGRDRYPVVPVPHVGRVGAAACGEPRDRPRPAPGLREGAHHPGDRGRGGRGRGGRDRRGDRWELRPPVRADKGDAVRRVVNESGARAVVVIGDDLGDLPAFAAVTQLVTQGHHGLRVAVRSAEAPPQLLAEADLIVDGPSGVLEFLRRLAVHH